MPSANNPRPVNYLVVGIDIGLTATGVAYAIYDRDSGPEWKPEEVKVVDEWFGTSRTHYKVPTEIGYLKEEKAVFKPWGFPCDPNAEVEVRIDHNKYNVEKYWKLDIIKPGRIEKVEMFFKDFLNALYDWIEKILGRDYNIENATVEYIFSVPTTWKTSSAEINKLKAYIRAAGFDNRDNRFFTIGLTEAEAAAVYAMHLSENPQEYKDETLMVCDAGGGTTDTTVLGITSVENGIYKTEQLSLVEGRYIGSIQIDNEFKELVQRRLENIEDSHLCDLRNVYILLGVIKKGLGTSTVDLLPNHMAEICNYSGSDSLDAGIKNGMMEFKLDEVRTIFDDKILKIIMLIENQLKNLKERTVDYLVLSGGLGSSHYVKAGIQKHFNHTPSPNAREIKIIHAKQPIIAVCKGLVIDRLLRLTAGIDVISRQSRASYGILIDEKFDKKRHIHGQIPEVDKVDGKRYAKDQIHWLLKQGTPINDLSPLEREFTRNIDNQKHMSWRDRVVIYTGPKVSRPRFLKEAEHISAEDFHVAREITSTLDLRYADPTVKKYKYWFRLGKYWEITYTVRIIVEAADVDFQLWFNNRQISGNPGGANSVAVRWEPEILDVQNHELE